MTPSRDSAGPGDGAASIRVAAIYASKAHLSFIQRAYVTKAPAHRAGPALARRGFAP